MTSRKAILSLAVLVIATAPLALAQGTYTQIDFPGAISTLVYGIDTAGDLVGTYADSNSVAHGFLLSGGAFTTIDDPSGSDTSVRGMNDEGQIVGGTGNSTVTTGFVYSITTQMFTPIPTFPGASDTLATGINNAGIVIGYATVYKTSKDWAYLGFELNSTTYTIVKPGQGSIVYGINGSGEVVGTAYNHALPTGSFLFAQGRYHELSRPNTYALGINDLNSVVGYDLPLSGIPSGFLDQNNVFRPIVFPGSTGTYALGINNTGEIVGYFYDQASNTYHGFTWTPAADGAKKWVSR